MSGFRVMSGEKVSSHAGIRIEANHTRISRISCSNVSVGIHLYRANNNTIAENNCTNVSVGIHLDEAHNNTIAENNCINASEGIHLDEAHNNTIAGNNCSWDSNSDEAIGAVLENSRNNTVSRNTFMGHFMGMMIVESNNTIVTDNLCSGAIICGIALVGTDNATMAGNTLSNNLGPGVAVLLSSNITLSDNICTGGLANGIAVLVSVNCTLTGNVLVTEEFDPNGTMLNDEAVSELESENILSTKNSGIVLLGVTLEEWTSHHIDESNTVDGRPVLYYKNRVGGIVPQGAAQVILANCTGMTLRDMTFEDSIIGVTLGHSSKNLLYNNSFSHGMAGIVLFRSGENTIIHNTCEDNILVGMGFLLSDNNSIEYNSITGNGYGFILLSAGNLGEPDGSDDDVPEKMEDYLSILTGGENNTLRYNDISGNEIGNMVMDLRENDSVVLDASHNWWGHPSGPYHRDRNPSGKGDEIAWEDIRDEALVTGNVNFDTWLSDPPGGVWEGEDDDGKDGRSESHESAPVLYALLLLLAALFFALVCMIRKGPTIVNRGFNGN